MNFSASKCRFSAKAGSILTSLMQAAEAEAKYSIGDRERLTIAANLALAIKSLHALKTYCIDLKPDNVRVNLQKGAVSIIDCDGMSVTDITMPDGRRFHADKSTPEYWAPENIGIKPQHFRSEKNHDEFALATIIFMLLNRGIHPFQGILLSNIPEAEATAGKIKNNLYPYGQGKGKIAALKDSLYPFWSVETKALFDRAFTTTTARPTAAEWVKYLGHLNAKATPCPGNPKYHVQHPGVGCPVCARNRSSSKTPAQTTGAGGARISTPPTHQLRGKPSSPPGRNAPIPASVSHSGWANAGRRVAITIVAVFAVLAGISWLNSRTAGTMVANAPSNAPAVESPSPTPAPTPPPSTPRKDAPMGGPLVPPPATKAPLDFSASPPVWTPAPQPPPPPRPQLTLRMKSNHRSAVSVAFYSTSDESRSWAGRTITDRDTHTFRLNCEAGEKICYAAWVTGGPLTQYWGVGRRGKQGCQDCCYTCPTERTAPIVLEPHAAKTPVPSLTWHIKSNHPNTVELAFYSDTRPWHEWPGGNQVYKINDWNVHTYPLTCQAGERILLRCLGRG